MRLGIVAVLVTSLIACGSGLDGEDVRSAAGSAQAGVSARPVSDAVSAKQPHACRGNGACDDGDPCTFNDKCVKGLCRGTAYTCNDGNACTNDVCDGRGGCQFIPNTAPCDDGNACTANDVCSAGRCSGTPLSCDDGNACTTDSCNPATGCVHTAVGCDDGNACTADSCDPAGGCTHTAISCDDGNVCTDDSCNPSTGCVHTANTAPCNDGNACTSGDVCSGGVCQGTPGPCCAVYETSCNDGIDNDCDGLVDFDDPDCYCITGPEWQCSNGYDDDCDGLTDSEDPDCALQPCTEGCGYGYGCFPDNLCHSHCEDGAQDYDESDADCGGADCWKCASGRRCNTGYDCASGICISHVCQ